MDGQFCTMSECRLVPHAECVLTSGLLRRHLKRLLDWLVLTLEREVRAPRLFDWRSGSERPAGPLPSVIALGFEHLV